MKKLLITFLGILLLAGCSDDKTVSSEKPETDSTSTEEISEPVKEENKIETEQNEGLTDLPEYAILSEKINLDTHKAIIETDNRGNRIILFENDNGIKAFKSIFVKNDNRLKIIKLDDDGLIYNDILN
ncbi:hypothetical protein FQ087_03075 [Sporosarcina sp. ANT_H38]|uniref:membrane lipoprotein lipid attachment site-containing protein n=1 Tax=Sporosarcina sp. ANT_H38 TaxID=2597358 RepID=UPI0011F3BC19|nr:membrane lipoprotein lipid attachment site-containing protein [Sporosarcina sp. ANT_H38]KAA0965306.1 hypothetical protein FQ087_03075 [Sporosarcina sp. ANT_H38]